jgi:uncharacterized protein
MSQCLRLGALVVGLVLSTNALSQVAQNRIEQLRALSISELEQMANGGDPDANLVLGYDYFSGERVTMDRHMALSYYSAAAALGSAMAMGNICNMYHYGLGVGLDDGKAYEWCEKAAKLGNPNAMVMIAEMVRDGGGQFKGLTPPYRDRLVFQLYEMAADRNHMVGQYHLGLCFEKGIGTDPNLPKALSLYHASASQGYAPAIDALTRLRR